MSEFLAILMAWQLAWFPSSSEPEIVLSQIDPVPPLINEEIDLSAQAVVIMEPISATVVWSKNPHQQRSIASLTKLMTAMVTLDHISRWREIEIPAIATATIGAKVPLSAGDIFQVDTLMTALLVRSANDAAMSLAHVVFGDYQQFIGTMNQYAADWGLTQTQFQNPHGLDAPGHHSTAFEVALIAKQALQYATIRRLAQQGSVTISDVQKKESYLLHPTNWLLGEGYYGLKTGTTDQAGQCFVGLIKHNGFEYLVVILGSNDRWADARTIREVITQ